MVLFYLQQHIRVKSLYQRFKRELQLKTSTTIFLSNTGDFSSWDLRGPENSFTELRSTGDQQIFKSLVCAGGKYSKPVVEGLHLGWQGTINPLSSGKHTPLVEHLGKHGSTNLEEEAEIRAANDSKEVSKPDVLHQRKIPTCKDYDTDEPPRRKAETKGEKVVGCYSLSLGFCADLKERWVDGKKRNRDSPRVIWRDSIPRDQGGSCRQDEFQWDNSKWKLKGSADSLGNCSVVKLLLKDGEVEGEECEDGAHRLRVSMSAGSWSPQASREAGITTGGIAVRSLLPVRYLEDHYPSI